MCIRDSVFDVRGILLYLSLIALLVFLTVQVVQKDVYKRQVKDSDKMPWMLLRR